MRRLRTITVDNVVYKWLFRYDDYDYQNDPYLLVVMESEPKSAFYIIFRMKEHFLLNSGLPVSFEGRETVINLNKPSLVSQIIRHCRENGELFLPNQSKKIDGIDILRQLGYEINSRLLE